MSRQVRQRLIRVDLCAPLAEDRLEVFDSSLVSIECFQLFVRESHRLTHRSGCEAEIDDGDRNKRRDRVDDRIDRDGDRLRGHEAESKSCRGCNAVTFITMAVSQYRLAKPTPKLQCNNSSTSPFGYEPDRP